MDANKDEKDLSALFSVHENALALMLRAFDHTNQMLASLNNAVATLQQSLTLLVHAQQQMNTLLGSLQDAVSDDDDQLTDLSGQPIRTS